MDEPIDKSLSQSQRPRNDEYDACLTYWQTVGQTWRTEPEIDEKRQKYLEEHRSITPDIKQSIYPFKGIKLSRADIEWLLVTHERGCGPVDWSDEHQRQRKGLDLRGADLRQVNLSNLPLARMCGGLTSVEFNIATVEQYSMARVHLEKAYLNRAHLEGVTLYGVHLDQSNLRGAHLESADLAWAHLERSILKEAHLEGADLRNIYFDTVTNLEKVILGDEQSGFALLADVHWGGVNLSVVNWTQMKMVGDQREALNRKTPDGKLKDKARRLDEYEKAIRANRQLAIVLQEQGLNEEAANFIYHAQVLQRWLLWQRRKIGQYLFSLFLDLIAGYGCRPKRSLLWYLGVIFSFAIFYFAFGHLPLLPDSLVLSLTSFHGRGFFPGLGNETFLHNPLVVLAAFVAVVGLFIEISFFATFTRRFFGN